MKIEAWEESFEVMREENRGEGFRVLYCRREGAETEFVFLHFTGERQVKTLLPYFLELSEKESYEDFRGCFIKEEGLYAVFYKKEGIALREALETDSRSLEERLCIGRRVLEKFMLWMLPAYMAAQLLDLEGILVTGETVAFDYAWRAPVELSGTMETVGRRLAGLTEALLEGEAFRLAQAAAAEYTERMRSGRQKDFFDLYKEYDALCDALLSKGETTENTDRLSLIKERAKMLAPWVLMLAAYLAAVLLLLAGIRYRKEMELSERVVFERIGTLDMRDTKSGNADGQGK